MPKSANGVAADGKLQDLSCMIEYACFHDYKNVAEALLNSLPAEGKLVDPAQSRVDLYICRGNVGDLALMTEEFYTIFINLESIFKSKSVAKGIEEARWFECRKMLAVWFILSMVADNLQLASFPTTLEEITIPSQFFYKSYAKTISRVIDDVFANFGYNVAVVEDVCNELKVSVTENLKMTNRKKITVSEAKILELFQSYSISNIKENVKSLLLDTEVAIFGVPEIHISYKMSKEEVTSAIDHVSHQEDWTEDVAASKGPYANGKRKKKNDTSAAPAVVPAVSAKASSVPSARSNFASPVIETASARQQPITPGRKHNEDVSVSKAVNDFQKKYAKQDPLEDAVSVTGSAKKRKAEEAVELASNKRSKVVSAPATSTTNTASKSAAAAANAASPKKTAPAVTKKTNNAKSIVAGRPSSSKINFDEEEEDEVDEYKTDEDENEGHPSRAMAILNNARNVIDDTTRKFSLPAVKLTDEKTSRFHPASASFQAKIRASNDGQYNRNPKLGTRNRVPWSAEEKRALVEGLRKHGQGSWATILKDPNFGTVLHERTNVDLKDKYRTMLKSGEVDVDDFQNDRGSSAKKSRSSSSRLGLDSDSEDEN